MTTSQPTEAEPVEPSKALAVSRDTTLESYRKGLEPRDLEQAYKFAAIVAKTRLNGILDEDDAMVRIVTGRELGLTAMQSVMAVFAFADKGGSRKIGIYAEVLEALCIHSGEFEKWEWKRRDNKGATLVAKRRGRPELEVSFTEEDAVVAGLIDRGADEEAKKKNNYNRYPRRMYTARCRAEMASLLGADITRGFKAYEEISAGDPNEMTGEIVSPPAAAAKAREVQAAQEALVKELVTKLKAPDLTKEQRAAVRAEIVAASKDGRLAGAYLAEVEQAYNETHPATAKEQAKGGGK